MFRTVVAAKKRVEEASMTTRAEWSKMLANALGNQVPDDDTIKWIAAWTAQENTKARYNPLATTQKWDGATDFNTVGVKNYPSPEIGIQATVKTLSYSFDGYQDIRDGIRTNNPEQAMDGLFKAPWGSNATSVQRIWLTTDVRNQQLPSFDSATSPTTPPASTGFGGGGSSWDSANDIKTPFGTIEVPDLPTNDDIGRSIRTALTPSPDLLRKIALGGIGVTFVLLALILAVRQYVPTKQIIETAVKAVI